MEQNDKQKGKEPKSFTFLRRSTETKFLNVYVLLRLKQSVSFCLWPGVLSTPGGHPA